MDMWTLASLDMIFICRKAVYWWNCMQLGDYSPQYAARLLKQAAFVAGACVFALGGALIGGIAGAMKGQTTETGFCRGAAIGVISGAIVALELLDSIINGRCLSKVGLFRSIVSGKAFVEWVCPAVLKAYQWQISMLEVSGNNEPDTDIYEIDETRGMSTDLISMLPMICFDYCQMRDSQNAVCCPICFEDLEDGERARILAGCEHLFHVKCIDQWLLRCASCPICRQQVA